MANEVKNTWLQCVIPTSEWDKINERRQKLNLKWNELILPAVLRQLTDLEVPRSELPQKHEITTANKVPAGLAVTKQTTVSAKSTKTVKGSAKKTTPSKSPSADTTIPADADPKEPSNDKQ
jgi:hypothetical protein